MPEPLEQHQEGLSASQIKEVERDGWLKAAAAAAERQVLETSPHEAVSRKEDGLHSIFRMGCFLSALRWKSKLVFALCLAVAPTPRMVCQQLRDCWLQRAVTKGTRLVLK